MLQAGFDADLAQEALGPDDGREVGRKDFDRDVAVMLGIARQVDAGHAAAADLSIHRVAIRERRSNMIQPFGGYGAHACALAGILRICTASTTGTRYYTARFDGGPGRRPPATVRYRT